MKTISEIRRENLDRILEEVGTQAEIARRMNRSAKQVNQWFGKGTARDMSSALARELEEVFGKPRGWMDNPADRSQAARLDPAIMGSALKLLQALADIQRTPRLPDIDPLAVIVAYETVQGELQAMDDGNIVDFMRKLAERLEQERGGSDGVKRREDQNPGTTIG